jgi:hypothetical protein
MRIEVAGRRADPSASQFVPIINPSNHSRLKTTLSQPVGRKKLLEQSARLDQASFGKRDGPCLPSWIGHESLVVKTVHGLPIEALPGSIDVMKPQVQQGQNGSVDFVIV